MKWAQLLFSPCQSGPAPKNEVHAAFLSDVKKALGPEKSAQLFQTIHSYKKTDNYENMVTTVVSLFTERDEDINLLASKFLQMIKKPLLLPNLTV